jgi:hypothetical protein
MQPQPIAGTAPAPPSAPATWTGRVLGLGVTDVLRVELEPGLVPWLVDQLDVLRDVYEDTVVHDRARWEEISEFAREARLPRVIEAEKDLDVSEFELRALDMIRGQLADAGGDETGPVAIYGPARIVAELVRETTRQVAATLRELLEEGPLGDAEARERVLEAAAAAKAWTERYVECEAVEWFTFDPEAAPTGS